jgi:two-component system phosphate regulon sensor histidine kinase PhoR
MAGELRVRFDALQRERDERELVLAHMSDGVALVDREGRVVHANRSAAAIVGAAVPPPAGTPLSSFARSPELDSIVQEARASAQVIEKDLRLWAPHQRLVRATATRLPGRDGGGVLLVLHDLTELERLNRVRQDFVANVSHELKTPLTSVRGYAETLLDGGLEDADRREEFVRVIRDQAKRLQDLVEDLLSLAELEREGARIEKTRFDLRQAAERQVADLQDRARRAGLALTIEPGEPAFVLADRGRVDQVLANLLDNALKYTERGAITVALGVDGGAGEAADGAPEPRVWCEIRDTGPGIAQEHQARIFERFYRVDDARSRERGGTGLGLSIVKHIVALHQGEVAVRSTLGRGSTFRFELPAA